MSFWPTSVSTNAGLYIAVNNLQTTLSGSIDNVVTTITLASTTGFPTAGGVTIDTEIVFYTGISGAQLTGCTRGADGTTAASHSSGVPVGATIIAFHHNGLKDEVIAIETSLDFTASRAMTSDGSGRLAVSAVTTTELGYLSGVTSAIQTQLNAKAPTASPTFTGTVTIPTPFTLGAISVTATGTELNYSVGVTSAIQTQLNAKAPTASPTFTGVALFASGTSSAPSIAFSADSSEGFYKSGTNQIGFATGSVAVWEAGQTGSVPYFISEGAVTITPTSDQLVLGTTRTVTITAPTPATSSRTWTIPDITANGTFASREAAETFSGQKTLSAALLGADGTISLPGYSFSADTNTGIYRIGTDEFGLVCNAHTIIDVSDNGIDFNIGATSTMKLRTGQLQVPTGTAGTPSYAFTGDTNTGLYQVDGSGSDTVGISGNGTLLARFGGGNNQSAGTWLPTVDNTYKLGQSGVRWTEVWAVNGTIQTSMLATKTNIEYMEPDECKIPKAIYFNRPTDDHSFQQLGFEADILPDEAHPVIDPETGERASENVYTSSVIAMLCQAARNDYDRLAAQDAKIATLESRLAALEAK